MQIKKIIFIIVAFSVSAGPIFAQSSSIPYWFLDVTVTNSLLGTTSQQRAYFLCPHIY